MQFSSGQDLVASPPLTGARAAPASRSPAIRPLSAAGRESYTGLKLFCPYLYRVVEKWAWPTFFTATTRELRHQMPDLKADIQQQLTELDSDLDLVALE